MLGILPRPLRDYIERRVQRDPHGTVGLVVRVLSEYAPTYWKRYAIAFAFSAVNAGATALMAYVLSHVVNQTYAYRNLTVVAALCGVILIVMAARGGAMYGQAIVLSRISNAITASNQRRIFEKLVRESLGFFADRHSSEFVGQIAYAASAAGSVLSLLVTSIGRDSLTVLCLLGVMAWQDPLIAVFAVMAMPITALVVRDVVCRIRNVAGSQYAANIAIMESVQEMVRGMRTIKAFNLEDGMERRVREQTLAGNKAADHFANLSNRSMPLMEALGGVAVAVITFYSGYRVISGQMMYGEAVSFIAAFMLAYRPIKSLGAFNITLNQNLASLGFFYGLIDSPPTEPDDEDKPVLTVNHGRIEFRCVDFCYQPDLPVLRDMSFVAEPGKVTALVGPSGGGKSTVFSLILRLYDVNAGKIVVDGQDIAAVSHRSLRQHSVYVGQDLFLFRGTIGENIGFGKPDANHREIVAAATAAHAHDFIMSFPDGYNTTVGEHGHKLSTGQRQRVSIARAFLKSAPLILLDEPTASLDSESERHVQDAFDLLCRNRTTMVIAHRLQTIMHADRIHFVEQGAIVESGTHQELLRRGRRYAAYYRLQFEEELERHRTLAQPLVRSL